MNLSGKTITGIIIASMLLLSGCGLLKGRSDYVPYSGAFPAHDKAEASRIESQSKYIYQTFAGVQTNTPAEKMLLGVVAMMQIAKLTPTRLNIIKPITGYDVLNNNLDGMLRSTLTGFIGWQAFDTIRNMAAVPGYVFNLNKGDLNADNSFNPSTLEQHQTYSTSSSLTSSSPRREPSSSIPTTTVPEVSPTPPAP